MSNFLKNKFSSNITQPLLISVLVSVILISIAVPAFNLVTLPSYKLLIFSFAGIAAAALVFAYRGNLWVGRIVVPIVLFSVISLLTYLGGLHDTVVFGYSAVILVAALLLGSWGSMIFGALSALVTLIVGLRASAGLIASIPNTPDTELKGAIIASTLILGATFILRILIERLNENARIAEAHEQSQIIANQELRALQVELEKRVEQRTAQLRASNEVGQMASSILDPEAVIAKAVNLITEVFSYYYAAIFLVTDNGRWAELKDATGSAGEILKSRRHRLQTNGSSMVGLSIATQKAQIALDTGETAIRFNNPLLPNTRSEIALPLIVGERVIGALDVQSTREADFKTEEIAALQGMANQVAIAIENARLFKEMDATLEELRQTNRGYIQTAWADKLKGTALEYTTKSTLASENESSKTVEISLNLRDQKIGQIVLETDGDWTQEDQTWVESLATQVVISLENARLLEESQQSAMRERLSASIVQKIWASNSIDTILQTTIRELGRALDASAVTIELKTEE
jgi:GAF domain-containing protein